MVCLGGEIQMAPDTCCSMLLYTDLTTYDYAKQGILRNSSLEDNALVHGMAR